MTNTIKIKRGLSSNINNTTLAQGELAITTDTNELYVGKESGKEKINVQANYNQNDEKATDYIKNRPFYEEEPFTLLANRDISFTISGTLAYSELLSYTDDLSKVSENSELTLSRGSNTITLTYENRGQMRQDDGSLLECLIFTGMGTAIGIAPSVTKLRIQISNPESSSTFTETINLSSSNIHKLDSKFIQSYPDIDLKPYLVGSTNPIGGTEYTKPTIVGVRDSNNNRLKVSLYSDGIIESHIYQ